MIPIIIPSFEPDERLIELLESFEDILLQPIIIVNDGSSYEYNEIFKKAEEIIKKQDGLIIKHDKNMGKGRALKTAFKYVIEKYPSATGIITADSDGQHTVECIKIVSDALEAHPQNLILGVRDFTGEGIPWKSRFGNKLTKKVFSYVAGIHISDTQTGLRGIPLAFAKELLNVKGERFEFETRMLLAAGQKYPIVEVPIQTIYDSEDNHQTHFNPVIDSIKIYKILAGQFFKYLFSSLSSSIVDLVFFTIFCYLLKGKASAYIAISTIAARIISATYNYIINYKLVFESRKDMKVSGIKYFSLAIIQMSLSALLVTGLFMFIPVIPEVVIKVIVDTLLFFISYHIQRRYIF